MRPRPGATTLGAAQPRAKLDAARGTLELVEGTASGARPAARVLDELTADGEALLRRAEALGDQVARLSLQRAQALRGSTAVAIEAVAAEVRAVGALLAHARRVGPDRQALERTLEGLDAAIVGERARVAAGADDIRAIVAFRGVELTLRECAARRAPRQAGGLGCWTSSAASGSTSRSRSSCAHTSSRRSSAVCSGWSGRCSAASSPPDCSRRCPGTSPWSRCCSHSRSPTFAVLPLNYGWAVLFLTPLVVLMVSFALGAGPAVAIDRIVDTLIGGAIAVAAATRLWPRSERGDFGPALGRALALDREYVSAVLAGRDAAPAGRRAATAADDLEARYRRLAGEPHRGRRGIGAVWEAVAANRRLYLATVALDAQLGGLGAEGVSGLDEIAAGLRDAIAAIADGHSAAPDPLERPLTGLRADVLALAERRTHELRANTALTPTAATLRRQALVLAQFDACGAALYRLRSAVRELSPSAA